MYSQPAPSFILTKLPGDQNAALITEYVIGYIIATERQFLQMKSHQDKCLWET